MIETYNRFNQNHDLACNFYTTCASSGKAITVVNETAVHSAFRISLTRFDPIIFSIVMKRTMEVKRVLLYFGETKIRRILRAKCHTHVSDIEELN